MVHWCESPDCSSQLDDCKRQDRFGWIGLQTLIEDACGDGVDLDETQVRCPMKQPPPGFPDPPWIGEFKTPGMKNRRHWRLYFGEPINYPDHVVGVRVWHKLAIWPRKVTEVRERDAIIGAMKHLKWYFKQQGYEWSRFPRG